MAKSQKEIIIRRQIEKKIQKLAKLEKELANRDFNSNSNEFIITRRIFACFDGFIILRTFSKTNFEKPHLHIDTNRLEHFIKNNLSVKAKDGRLLNLYNLLKLGIGLTLKLGSTIDLGSQGGGLTIANLIEIDGFQIMIRSYENLSELEETIGDIKFILLTNKEITQLEIENNILRNKIAEIDNYEEPLIITEGKTDWKYFHRALEYFHARSEFLNIDENWFLKFGTEKDHQMNICGTNIILQNSVSNLNKILDSFIESRSLELSKIFPLRIGIFDSDDKNAKIRDDKKTKVYSIIIEPNNISTELLFLESEIKTKIKNRRLFLGDEFDSRTGQMIKDRTITLGNDNNTRNKAGTNKVIDSDVFDSIGENIALSKDEFSTLIFSGEIKICDESWENFRHVFQKINNILENYN